MVHSSLLERLLGWPPVSKNNTHSAREKESNYFRPIRRSQARMARALYRRPLSKTFEPHFTTSIPPSSARATHLLSHTSLQEASIMFPFVQRSAPLAATCQFVPALPAMGYHVIRVLEWPTPDQHDNDNMLVCAVV